nr:ATP-dependent RNA helicase DDX24-like isoform X1 [Procambarus clarkii]XP_045594874.1 ATP-dependent RNA helicase DDX24-like isoform X1 [Procambarus clarkii]
MGKNRGKAAKKSGAAGNSSLLSAPVSTSHEFEGLAGFEEITSCTLMKLSKRGPVKKEVWEDGKIVKKKNKKVAEVKELNIESELGSQTKKEKKKKKKKKKKKASDLGDKETDQNECMNEIPSEENIENLPDQEVGLSAVKKNKRKKQHKTGLEGTPAKKARYDSATFHGGKKGTIQKVDVSAWEKVFVPPPVLQALAELGFSQPTEIQKLVLPAAIKGRMDIIGAAETGSGKTLAFGIPIIHGILVDKKHEAECLHDEAGDSGVENSDLESEHGAQVHDVATLENSASSESIDDDDDDDDILDADNKEVQEGSFDNESDDFESDAHSDTTSEKADEDNTSFGCVKVIDDVDFDFLDENVATKSSEEPQKPLRALIVTPTRELAIQIKSHLAAVLVHTDIQTAVIMGGVSHEKQERLLRRGPEIVIGTPGRLWELIEQGNKHLTQVPDVRYLAIDETDRMVERGHFQELTQLLELINSNKEAKEKRQTFVFSATLSIVHSVPKRINMKRKTVKMTSELKIDQLAKIIGVKSNPKVVDVTRKFGTAESLTEARINCSKEEKDIYLYYFLKCYPGRTLVFCNSIDCVRRLQNLFTLLQCHPQSLHASMQQKQRLKSLERFSSNKQGLLLATDVAARGLDIPNIMHVIHYQVPRTAETYIHRSGRTARACQEGLSILLIEMAEIKKYRQLCNTLNRATDLPPFPIDASVMSQVKKRINLARMVEKMEHTIRKTNAEKDWFRRAAEEAELLIESDDCDEDDERENSMKAAQEKRDLQNKRESLMRMLSMPFIPLDFSGKYPTHTGSLIVPHRVSIETNDKLEENSNLNSALSVMKKESKEFLKLVKSVKFKPKLQKLNKKKFKGFEKRKLKLQKEREKYLKESTEDD